MIINWTQLQLPGGTAFVACFLGQYGFGYDTRMNAYARLVPALKARVLLADTVALRTAREVQA